MKLTQLDRGAGDDNLQAQESTLEHVLETHQQLDISSQVKLGQLRAIGGFADVYDGWLSNEGTNGPRKVAVKRFRVILEGRKDFARSIARELLVWVRLEHSNVLPMLGFMVMDNLPSLVSEWMVNGTVRAYVASHPKTSVFTLVREVASGLAYLHENGIVHADLRSDNILVSAEGRAMLSDFGISRLLAGSMTLTGTTTLKGNVRWMAVELMDSRSSLTTPHLLHTKATDVWAFGMVICELLTGGVPFANLPTDVLVIMAIVSDQRPPKPTRQECREDRLDFLWDKCISCWMKRPEDRPDMSKLVEDLGKNIAPVQLTIRRRLQMDSVVFAIAFSPDGTSLAASSMHSSIRVWDLQNSTLRYPPSTRHADSISSLAWTPMSDYILSGSLSVTPGKWGATVGKWDASSGGFVSGTTDSRIKHPSDITAIACSADGTRVLSASKDQTILVWNISDWTVALGPLHGQRGRPTDVKYSPDGTTILACFSNGSICAWDATSGELLFGPSECRGQGVAMNIASYHPNGNIFVTGSGGNKVRVWNARDFEVRETVRWDHGPIRSVQFSLNGKYMSGASLDGTVVVWDAATMEVCCVFRDASLTSVTAKFSPDGRTIASGSGEGQIIIYDFREL